MFPSPTSRTWPRAHARAWRPAMLRLRRQFVCPHVCELHSNTLCARCPEMHGDPLFLRIRENSHILLCCVTQTCIRQAWRHPGLRSPALLLETWQASSRRADKGKLTRQSASDPGGPTRCASSGSDARYSRTPSASSALNPGIVLAGSCAPPGSSGISGAPAKAPQSCEHARTTSQFQVYWSQSERA
jgi:hypothetical protein